MKLLLDTCMSAVAAAELRAVGHDVVWSGDWPADPGDIAILAQAAADGRILVTTDRDFGELVVVHRQPHAGVIRLVQLPPFDHAAFIAATLDEYGTELEAGAIVTIERRRTRIRRNP